MKFPTFGNCKTASEMVPISIARKAHVTWLFRIEGIKIVEFLKERLNM
jgi:hypothetical protein